MKKKNIIKIILIVISVSVTILLYYFGIKKSIEVMNNFASVIVGVYSALLIDLFKKLQSEKLDRKKQKKKLKKEIGTLVSSFFLLEKIIFESQSSRVPEFCEIFNELAKNISELLKYNELDSETNTYSQLKKIREEMFKISFDDCKKIYEDPLIKNQISIIIGKLKKIKIINILSS